MCGLLRPARCWFICSLDLKFAASRLILGANVINYFSSFSAQMSLKSESQLGSDKTESYFHQSPSDITMSGYKAPSSSQKFRYDSRDSQMPQQSIGPQRSPTRSSGPPRHKKPKGGSLPPSVASTPRASARKQATRLSPSPTGRKQSSRPSPTLSGRKEATPSPTPVPRSAQPKARFVGSF